MAANKNDLINQIRKAHKQVDNIGDRAILNEKQRSGVVIKDDGTTGLIGGNYAQIRVDEESGSINSVSLQESTTTVQKNIHATDINVNNHKLNNQLYELTDYKQLGEDGAIGGMTMQGYVMVKTWEPNLEKYVLIRRLARLPVFSYEMNPPSPDANAEINTDITKDLKDYQIRLDNKLKVLYADLTEED